MVAILFVSSFVMCKPEVNTYYKCQIITNWNHGHFQNQSHFPSEIKSQRRKARCKTTPDSLDNFQPCVFPFKYKGVTYNECPQHSINKDRAWCPTELSNNGIFEEGSEYWGFCNENCPLLEKGPGCPRKGEKCQDVIGKSFDY